MCSILVAFFQVLVFGWKTMTSVLQKKNANILGDGKPIVLWQSMRNPVNFFRQLTSIKVLCLAKLKAEHCSQQ